MYDLIIIGAGPAGLTAAIYAARACLNILVIEENFVSGGQLLNNYKVNNYPGFYDVSGMELGYKMRDHALSLDVPIVTERVLEMNLEGRSKVIMTERGTYETQTVILATGCEPKKLYVPGEEELLGQGVSYSAVCDGPYCQGADVAVIGGGDSAVTNALYLSKICKTVYLLSRAKRLRAMPILCRQLAERDNIIHIPNQLTDSIAGDNHVGAVWMHDLTTMEKKSIHVDHVFVSIGVTPKTDVVRRQVYMDDEGYIRAGEDCCTTVPGVFVVGDIRTKKLRQIVTACADGANAVVSARYYLESKN